MVRENLVDMEDIALAKVIEQRRKLTNRETIEDPLLNVIGILSGEPISINNRQEIISPIKKKSLLEVFANLEDIDEEFPNVDEGLLPLDEIEL